MVVGICRIVLLIHDSRSLKGKRKVLKSVMARVKNRFNVAVAEVGSNENWQRAEIGLVCVGNDGPFVNSMLDKALNFIEGLDAAEVIDHGIELVNC